MADPTQAQSELDQARMPFFEHLRELRDRLRNAVIALFIGTMIAMVFRVELYVLLAKPLINVWNEAAQTNPAVGQPALYFKSLIEPFWTLFSVALWAGVFVSSPFIFHQIWKFIAPGLYKRERRYGVAFAIVSAMFFVSGAAFCYFIVLEPIYEFLLGYADADLAKISRGLGVNYELAGSIPLKPQLFMEEYLGFAKKLLIGFGLVFELPLLILFLSLAGMVTHRSLWKFNRWALILAFVASAALTPPDVVSQVLMAGPIVVLYNLSIVISWVITFRREARERALYEDDPPPDPGGATPDDGDGNGDATT